MTYLNMFDPFKGAHVHLDDYFKSFTEPAIPLTDMMNYVNALNQLNVSLSYKYMNGQAAKLFGVNQSNMCCQHDDVGANPFFDTAMKYQQQNMQESMQANMNSMFNAFWPLKIFSPYNS